jgi:hypothetical protein
MIESQAVERKLNFIQTMKAVVWAMFGVRRKEGLREDIGNLNPVYVALTGILFGVVFVTSLVFLAKWVVYMAVAGLFFSVLPIHQFITHNFI